MSDRSERLFRRLPDPLRTVAASLHGHRLRRWRYGPETDALVRDAHERETWGQDRWEPWLDERRKRLEARAHLAPHYREHGPTDDGTWPLLDKQVVRAEPERLVADDVERSKLYEEHTSGSTGTPLRLWWSRETTRRWYALFEARARGWYGVDRREPWAILGGRLVVAVDQARPPFWVWNAGMQQLYLSGYHLTAGRAAAYADAIERREVRHLVGYPSALATLAELLIDQDRTIGGVRAVIGNAEPVTPAQRAAVRVAFDSPLVETYGMAELAAAASACPSGSRHVWPEVGDIEIVDGELVATGLLNLDMPLIRYRTGDRLSSPPRWDHDCACGRRLPVIDEIDGRVDDVVVTPDGRRLGRLDPIFKADLPIREAQIIQDRADHLLVRVVVREGMAGRVHDELRRRVLDHVGAMDITIEEVTAIERGPNGKFRAVLNQMDEAS